MREQAAPDSGSQPTQGGERRRRVRGRLPVVTESATVATKVTTKVATKAASKWWLPTHKRELKAASGDVCLPAVADSVLPRSRARVRVCVTTGLGAGIPSP